MAMSFEGYDNRKGWWFHGNGSFISNGYVIYKDGLDGDPANPIALTQGTNLVSLLDNRNAEVNAAFAKIIHVLKSIADTAAAEEDTYLRLKVAQMLKDKDKRPEVAWINKIQEAVEQKDYNSAYTLLLKRQKDLEAFREEIKKSQFKQFAKTKEFYNTSFRDFLLEKFTYSENKSRTSFEMNLESQDFSQLVDEYFIQSLDIENPGENPAVAQLRQSFIDQLNQVAYKGNIKLGAELEKDGPQRIYGSAVIRKKDKNLNVIRKDTLSKLITKKGKFKNRQQLMEALASDLVHAVGNGLGQEVYVIGAAQDIGVSRVQGTGAITYTRSNYFGQKYAKVQGKDDIRIIDVFEGIVDVNKLAREIAQKYEDGEMSSKFLSDYTEALKRIAKVDDVQEIFDISINVKGYTSYRDLQIEGEGPFINRVTNLQKVGVEGLGEKLIFMLNNTAQGAVAEGREEEIKDYIAAVCAAWIWSKPGEIFDMNLSAPSNYHKIRLFNSGTAYFTASQIMYQTIDRLQGLSNNQFVKVGITPPPHYGNYQELKEIFPQENYEDRHTWQDTLQWRWEAVKMDALRNGTLSIHFDQTALNELLSNLKMILG